MILLENVSKQYDGDRYAVRDVSLRVPAGQMLVLLGGSGCGKTTTLKMINRLIEPTSGRIEVNGQDVRAADPVQLRRGIGYVFQGIGLFPHLTVAENVAVVPKLLGWPRRADRTGASMSCSTWSTCRRRSTAAGCRRSSPAGSSSASASRGAGRGAAGDAPRRAVRRPRPGDARRAARRVPELRRRLG